MKSGADASVLPESWLEVGVKQPMTELKYRDAQGNNLRIGGVRQAEVILGSGNGTVRLKENFVIAPVSAPLLALGKLVRAGWQIGTDEVSGEPILQHGQGTVDIFFIVVHSGSDSCCGAE